MTIFFLTKLDKRLKLNNFEIYMIQLNESKLKD